MDNVFRNEDIHINQDFLYQRFGNNQESREAYMSSFIQMSRKGFVSLDRTNVMDITDQTYHVVCFPNRFIEFNIPNLPFANGQILNGNLGNIHLLDFFNKQNP